MHLSLLLWCAILSFTAAQELSDSTSTSRNAAVPWITYTSTRSCTTQPSTVFVYTSNLTTFLLPQPGPNSAITPLNSNAASSAYDAGISVASNDGLATGEEGTTHASSGDSGSFVSATGSEDPSATPFNTIGTTQSTPWATESSAVTPSASNGDSGSFVAREDRRTHQRIQATLPESLKAMLWARTLLPQRHLHRALGLPRLLDAVLGLDSALVAALDRVHRTCPLLSSQVQPLCLIWQHLGQLVLCHQQ